MYVSYHSITLRGIADAQLCVRVNKMSDAKKGSLLFEGGGSPFRLRLGASSSCGSDVYYCRGASMEPAKQLAKGKK